MKEKLKEALVFMVTEYCKYKKEGNEILALSTLENISGFKLGLYYAHVFTYDELDQIENDVKAEWGYNEKGSEKE